MLKKLVKPLTGIVFLVLLISILRTIFLRFFVETTFPFFPASNSINYSMLDDIYRGDYPPALWGWGNFDGNHYIGIAMRGYGGYEHPFFPLYPFLIKFVADFGLQPLISAQLISFISKLLFLIVVIKLLKIDKKVGFIPLFVAVVIFYPTSFYYSAAYNDSLFLLLATLTIFFARKKRWIISGIVAALATFTRLNGLVLVPFILCEYLFDTDTDGWNLSSWFKNIRRRIFSYRFLDSKIYAVLLSPLAFIGYLYYIQKNYGSWTLMFSNMSLWGQEKMIFPLQTFYRYVKMLIIYPSFNATYLTAILEILSVFLYIFLLIKFYRRIRVGYWLFMALSILLPGLTGTFQGMPRYGLHLYPFFLMLIMLIYNWQFKYKFIYFVISISLLLLLTLMFVHGYFIA